MNPLTTALTDQHAGCDALFALAEDKAAQGLWADAVVAFDDFRRALEIHLQGEENVLFPAFEAATGNRSGPTQVMRQEHERMRALLDEIEPALLRNDAEQVDDFASTLLILMQQHNMKEQGVLYPMCDFVLGGACHELLAKFGQGSAATCPR